MAVGAASKLDTAKFRKVHSLMAGGSTAGERAAARTRAETELAGLSLPTIKRMERLGPGRSSADNVEAVKRALEEAGVAFIDANGGGAGVRLRNP